MPSPKAGHFRIDPARSRIHYRGESSGLVSVRFVNDRSRTTGTLFFDPWGNQLFGGELTTKFEALPGKRDSVDFRRKLGVIKPHALKLRALDAESCIEFEADIGFGAHRVDLVPKRAVVGVGKPLEIAGTIRTGFELFAIAERHKSYAMLLTDELEFDVELHGDPI